MSSYEHPRDAFAHNTSEQMRNDPSIMRAQSEVEEYESRQERGATVSLRLVQKTGCTYADLLDAVLTRRANRNYSEDSVSRDTLEKIVEVVD